MFQIFSKKEMAQGTIIANEIIAPQVAKKAKPGQFIILKVNDTGERIPLTIAENNPDKGIITIIYQVVGKTTILLRNLNVNEYIQDIVGPLGTPMPIAKEGIVVCVGGGTGIAVLYPIARGFKEVGNKVIVIIGARTKELLILEDKMRIISDELYVCTDDGSYGYHGFVTNLLQDQLIKLGNKIKKAICIGPLSMMKNCSIITKKFGISTSVSLNAIMIDGTGMCGCCRVNLGNEIKFACVDGPEFNAHKVNFDALFLRLLAYKKQEQEAIDIYQQKCLCSIKLKGIL